MGKLFKLLGILLVISLLVLSLAACYESSMTLVLTVDTPQDGATVTENPVTVSGTLNKTATVKINDVVVPVKGGKFSTSVTLTEGQNVINVVAAARMSSTSGEETVSKAVTVTYIPAK